MIKEFLDRWPRRSRSVYQAHPKSLRGQGTGHRSLYLKDRVKLMQWWADYLDGRKTGNVVKMPKRKALGPWQILARGLSPLRMEDGVDVSSTMQHTHHIDPVIKRNVENNVPPKWKAAHSRHEFVARTDHHWLGREHLERWSTQRSAAAGLSSAM